MGLGQSWRPWIFDDFECSSFDDIKGSTCYGRISTQSALEQIYKLTSVEKQQPQFNISLYKIEK